LPYLVVMLDEYLTHDNDLVCCLSFHRHHDLQLTVLLLTILFDISFSLLANSLQEEWNNQCLTIGWNLKEENIYPKQMILIGYNFAHSKSSNITLQIGVTLMTQIQCVSYRSIYITHWWLIQNYVKHFKNHADSNKKSLKILKEW
jgi:hypothetical protein